GDHDVLGRDRILDNVTLYWLTGTAGTSANWYLEDARAGAAAGSGAGVQPSGTPTGVAVFAYDFQTIRRFAERDNTRIVHWSEFKEGGHFAAMETPGVLADDIRAFARTVLPKR